MSNSSEFVIERTFDAPVAMVWKTWSDPELLARWYGPGAETKIHEFDLRPGGSWRNEMKWGDKRDLSRMDFQEVIEGQKISWHHFSADANWNITTSSMMPDWPRVILTTVTFEDMGGTTKLRLALEPVDPTPAELACFTSVVANMGKGWNSGFAVIDDILTELQA